MASNLFSQTSMLIRRWRTTLQIWVTSTRSTGHCCRAVISDTIRTTQEKKSGTRRRPSFGNIYRLWRFTACVAIRTPLSSKSRRRSNVAVSRSKFVYNKVGISDDEISQGNLLDAPREALVNTVNTVGV